MLVAVNSFFIKDPQTIKLDKAKGSRTTSIKTLSTLIPLVMCLDCYGVGTEVYQEYLFQINLKGGQNNTD
jgi:hypothetical protein